MVALIQSTYTVTPSAPRAVPGTAARDCLGRLREAPSGLEHVARATYNSLAGQEPCPIGYRRCMAPETPRRALG